MGSVWDRTAEFLTDNLSAIVPIALLAFFVPFSIQGNLAQVNDNAGANLQLILQLVSLAFSVLALWGSLAVSAMALDIADGRTAGALAGRRLVPALLVSIAVLAIVLLAMAPPVAVLWANGHDLLALARNEATDIAPALAWPLALYMIVAVLLLLWIGARLALASTVVVAERKAFGALRRSFALTSGITLKMIGVLLLYALVSGVAALATKMVFGSIFQLIAGPADNGLSLSQVLTSVMVATVQTAFTVIAPVFTAKLYLALTAEHGRVAQA
jgi:hypothetical protein